MKLSVPHIHRTWRSSISPELINVTQVLLELVTVRVFVKVVFVFRNLMTFLLDSLLNAFALAKFLSGFYEVFIR